MTTTQHTGGNWYVERIHTMADKTPHDYDIWAVYSTQRTRYADKPQDICFFNWRTPAGKANAHLISSAPDMFQALQAIVDAFGDQNSLLIDQCKAAIAKAEGRTK